MRIALKIREVAGEHDIPIVENVPLARALYATVKIDDEIPVEHYQAVAAGDRLCDGPEARVFGPEATGVRFVGSSCGDVR